MANLYKLFESLLPNQPLLVGTVISVQTGQCIIELPGGGRVTGRGNANIGQKVFVRDGVIEGQAPNLTVQVIEV